MSGARKGRAAPHVLPDPPTASSAMAMIRSLLPDRSADDIVAERIRFQLGDAVVVLPVLPIEANETWTALLNERFGGMQADLEGQASAASILTLLSGMTNTQLELLRAYDHGGLLPADEWIRQHATATQLVKALLGVTAAAFPLADLIIRAVLESPDLQTAMRSAWSMSTSSLPPNGAGLQSTSAVS